MLLFLAPSVIKNLLRAIVEKKHIIFTSKLNSHRSLLFREEMRDVSVGIEVFGESELSALKEIPRVQLLEGYIVVEHVDYASLLSLEVQHQLQNISVLAPLDHIAISTR
jgi:hypothetical protein